MQGDVVVAAGVTLTIGAGAQVEGSGAAGVVVDGHLSVIGTSAAPVTFGAPGSTAAWKCVVVRPLATASIQNASMHSCDTALLINGSGAVTVSNVDIVGAYADAISVVGGTAGVTLDRVSVDGARVGLRASSGDTKVRADRLTVNNTQECANFDSASNITLTAMRFTNCGQFGAVVSLSSDITLTNGLMDGWITSGVYIVSSTRVTVTNNWLNASIGLFGVRLLGASNCTVENNVVLAIDRSENVLLVDLPIGIHDLLPTGPNRVARNTVWNYSAGIRVESAIFPQVLELNVVKQGVDTGIEILDSPNQTVNSNTLTGRRVAFAVNVSSPITFWYYRQYLDGNNTADGRTVLWLLDRANQTLDVGPVVGMVGLIDSRNVTLTNFSLERGSPSLLIVNSTAVAVRAGTITSRTTGVAVVHSTAALLENLTVTGGLTCLTFRDGTGNRAASVSTADCTHALLTEGSEANLVVSQLTVTRNGRVAFYQGSNLTLQDSRFEDVGGTAISNEVTRLVRGGQLTVLLGKPAALRVVNVTVVSAQIAIEFTNFSDVSFDRLTLQQAVVGLRLTSMAGVRVFESNLSGQYYGVEGRGLRDSLINNSTFGGSQLDAVFCKDCDNVTFRGNLFAGNGVGMAIIGGQGCVVTRNLFFYNSLHASTNTSDHAWDDGAVGNLWDDYTGPDADGNGIGDVPWPVYGGFDSDRYPITRYPDFVAPVADAGPDIVTYEDAPVLLTALLSSDDVGIRAYLWSFVEQGANVTVQGVGVVYFFHTPGRYLVTLTVIDWGGNRATDTLNVTVLDRTDPRADAGGNRVADEDVAVGLDAGRSTDNDPGFPAGAVFTWYVYDRDGVHILFGAVGSWVFSTPGNYTVVLVVDDAAGFADSDTVYLVIRDTTPPLIDPLTAPEATEDSPFRAYGAPAFDNDPSWPAGKTEWFELWQGNTKLAYTNETPGVFNVSQPGLYTVGYFVADASGNIGSVNITFAVADITPPDTRLFGDRQGESGEPVTFDLSPATDNDPSFPAGANATWTISVASGRVVLYGYSVIYTFALIGDYAMSLSVRDPSGNLAEVSFSVHIRDTRAPLVTIAGPLVVEAGVPVIFNAAASDATALTEFLWSVTGLTSPRFGAQLAYRFSQAGSYQVSVHVEDQLGHGANATVNVLVVDTTKPSILIEFTPLARDGAVQALVFGSISAAFLGSDNVQVVRIEWAWGDGNVTEGTTTSHAYTAIGNYTVLVRVVDGAGNANTTTMRVSVAAPEAQPPPPPDNNATTPQSTGGIALGVVAAIAVAGAAGGVVAGIVAGRRTRRPPEAP